MSAKIMDGKSFAKGVRSELKKQVASLFKSAGLGTTPAQLPMLMVNIEIVLR
jgi:hypothetical protein